MIKELQAMDNILEGVSETICVIVGALVTLGWLIVL